ncbi:MAG: hypothetical protein GY795_46340 [Desulfobacterales bacterium]|nr:hypothetical protein [Desulfobacterales bacterium]
MKYEAEFAELENGEKPFEEFVLNLPIKERAKLSSAKRFLTAIIAL